MQIPFVSIFSDGLTPMTISFDDSADNYGTDTLGGLAEHGTTVLLEARMGSGPEDT